MTILLEQIGPKKPVVFIDFDNTISKIDTIDDILVKFSKDDKWVSLENDWKKGKIASRECLKGQLKSIQVTKTKLNKYLSQVRIDPYFKKLISLFQKNNIPMTIVSDNFDYLLRFILRVHGIKNVKVYCNSLSFSKNGLIPRFPRSNRNCCACAHCKTKSTKLSDASKYVSIYIGDGRSDVCAAKNSNIIFAKDYLSKALTKDKITHIPIISLKDVYTHLRKVL
ncbi:MAG: MtnX-like HAD-IB family phosphatase, partial [Candidatus Omnitrophica bacterium]|nr:MtnX-like HAD-IB family phosphatase [Candidatus Omnitrophota bacterium]